VNGETVRVEGAISGTNEAFGHRYRRGFLPEYGEEMRKMKFPWKGRWDLSEDIAEGGRPALRGFPRRPILRRKLFSGYRPAIG